LFFLKIAMTENEIYDLLDRWENIEVLMQELSQNAVSFSALMHVALNRKEQRSWRAAYVADKIHDNFPELLRPYIPEIIGKLKTENNASKRRHWLKLIASNPISLEHSGFLFDFCIRSFTSSSEAVAVRVHAMQILYNISDDEPGLKPEVLALIQHEMEYHSSAGIKSRGKKLVAKLQKQIRRNTGL
jgi:hypothetical protein